MRDQAIFNTHPTAVRIVASKDAYDKDKNPITLNESAIATELARLELVEQEKLDNKEFLISSIRSKLGALGLTAGEMGVIGIPEEVESASSIIQKDCN